MTGAGKKGFSLVEILLGLSIFVLVSVSLYMTFNNALFLKRRTEQGRIVREMQKSIETLTRDLQDMVYYSGQGLGFKGEETRVCLVLPSDAGLKNVCYYAQAGEAGRIDFVREERLLTNGKTVSRILSRHLFPGTPLRFFYGLNDRQDGKPTLAWLDRWQNSFFPAGVRVEIEFKGDDQAARPEKIQKDIFVPLGLWGEKKY